MAHHRKLTPYIIQLHRGHQSYTDICMYMSVSPPFFQRGQPPPPLSTQRCHPLIRPNRRSKFITQRKDWFTPVVYVFP